MNTAQGDHPERVIDTRLTKIHERSFAAFKRGVQLQRLKELQKMGLATQVKPGIWKLDDRLESTLKELGEKGDIIKTMHKSLKKDPLQEKVLFDPNDATRLNITGVVIDKRLKNELFDEKYLIVSATDNRAYYVPLGRYSESPGFESRPGSIVTVSVKKAEGQLRKSDQTIARIADGNAGVYSREAHLASVEKLRLPEGVTAEAYVENHVKRLEALEKRAVVERTSKGWKIPKNLDERIMQTADKSEKNFARVKLESMQDLSEQVRAVAPTWIDTEIAAGRIGEAAGLQSEFLSSLARAKEERLTNLCELGQAVKTAEGIQVKDGYRDRLYKLQMQNFTTRQERSLGTAKELKPGEAFKGEIKKIEHLPSGAHAIISDGHSFVAVPYQKGMDRFQGRPIKLEMSKTNRTDIIFSLATEVSRKAAKQIEIT